jgi:protoporphyrinogen/coproporphyrinogen III oxidase
MMLWAAGASFAVWVAVEPELPLAVPFAIWALAAGAARPLCAPAPGAEAEDGPELPPHALSSRQPDSRMTPLRTVLLRRAPRASVMLVMPVGRARGEAGSAFAAIIGAVTFPILGPRDGQQRPGRVAVIGGGISGLAAAFLLRDRGLEVTVLEGAPRLGGKLAVSDVAGTPVDAGAEALLARRPEGTDLISAVGLADELVLPGTTSAGIWTRGRIRALPRRQFMGVPADLDELAATGILSADGLARARLDLELPAADVEGDVSVAARVGGRFGAELVDRLVEPLLGGVYAGSCSDLSFRATLPGLAQAAGGRASLAEAAATLLPPAHPAANGRPAPPPVFTTLAAGLGSLPPVLAARSGARVRTNAMVRELARTADGWRLTVGSAHAPEAISADAVIIAAPARPASRLIAQVDGGSAAATALAEIKYASMAIVTLAYPAAAFPRPPGGSGFLVPAVDGRAVKAVTFSTVKWPHLERSGPGLHIVRCSVGRIGEEAVLQRDDAELAALAAADLTAATGVRGTPADVRVTRWGGGLPQYSVGHLDRIARVRAGVAGLPGLAVCGAAFDGVGIPACIASARIAVDQVADYLSAGADAGCSSAG